jgi:hypothetical protein
MRVRNLAIALTMVMVGMFLGTGCSTSNEENIKGPTQIAPKDPNAPAISSYGDAVKYNEAQQKEKAAAARKAPKK